MMYRPVRVPACQVPPAIFLLQLVFCLQAVKNQGFSVPIQSQYSFWSEHLYCKLAKCQRMPNSPYTPISLLFNVMLSQETSSPVAELTWGSTPTAKNVINHGAIF